MARLTITLRRDAECGGHVIRVGLRPDSDMTPCEHEDTHQRLVAELLPGVRAERDKPTLDAPVG